MITRNIYTAFSLTLMTIIFASCQNDEIESSQAVDVSGKSSVTIHCVMGSETMSRAQIVLGYDGEGELFRWNEGDSFSLFDYGADGTTIPTEQTVFTITDYSDDSQSNIADFTAECDIEEGNYVFAVYPTVSENDYWSLNIAGYNLGTNSDDEIKAYMKENMFMYAEGKMEGDDTDLTFNHLTALARITYTNDTGSDRTISKVSISGDGDYFSYNVEKWYNPSQLKYTDEKASEEIYFENLILADGDSTEFYILFLPGDDFNTDGTITVAVDDFTLEVATSEFDTTSFEAGYRYWFVLTETENASNDTSSNSFTPGGQFTTSKGSVYLTQAAWNGFFYTDGKLTSACLYDHPNNKIGDVEDSYTVTYDPMTFTGTYIQLTDIEQNSDGFITSLSKTDTERNRNLDFYFYYDSSGHLTDFKEVGTTSSREVAVSFTLTWSNDTITNIVRSEDDDNYITYSSFEYSSDYPNVTLQYGAYVESICEGYENGLEMLFYLGYLGKAPAYHPISFYCVETYDGYDYGDLMFYTPTLNSDGSLKEVARAYDIATDVDVTYTFEYE